MDSATSDASAWQSAKAVSWAASIGLLELATFVLAAVAILLALGGIITYFNYRHLAKKEARKEAERVARRVAEQIAIQYLEAELPKLWKEYQQLAESGIDDEEANQIAAAQTDGDSR